MTTPDEDALPIAVPADPPRDTYQTVTLTQHMLGLNPYTLIEAVKDEPDDDDAEDDGLRLRVVVGGGAEGPELAALYLLNLPAAENPLTAAIKHVLDSTRDFAPSDLSTPEAFAMFAEYCGVPMPGSDES